MRIMRAECYSKLFLKDFFKEINYSGELQLNASS